MRIAVTGRDGQVARSLIERAAGTDVDVIPVGRPALDLANPDTIDGALAAIAADVLISAAAYTDVNKAEAEPELADLINGRAAGLLAARAAALGTPLIHLSTDYVFDGTKTSPYVEGDTISPINAYGRSKAAGECAVAAAHPRHVILRTSWVYSPFNRNFVRTMLELARKQDTVRVVSDQVGNPTAASDIADGVLAVARRLIEGRGEERYGTFHMAAAGSATWADVARPSLQPPPHAAARPPTLFRSRVRNIKARRGGPPTPGSMAPRLRACTALHCRPGNRRSTAASAGFWSKGPEGDHPGGGAGSPLHPTTYPLAPRALRHLAAYGSTNMYRPVNNSRKSGSSGSRPPMREALPSHRDEVGNDRHRKGDGHPAVELPNPDVPIQWDLPLKTSRSARGRLQSVRARTCSRFAKNCCHPALAPP